MHSPSTDTDQSILKYFSDVVADRPDDVAFTEVHPEPAVLPSGKGNESITFREFNERSTHLASAFVERGIGEGDVVSFQLPNWVEFPLVYLAALKAGATASPLLPALRESEVSHTLSLCESSMYVTPTTFRGFSFLELFDALRDADKVDVDHYVAIGDDARSHESVTPFEELEDTTATSLEPTRASDDLAQITFTTGTTGEPKGVRQTVRTGMSQLRPPTQVMGIDSDDVLFGAMPLAHNGGFHYIMRTPLLTGCRTVLFDKWNPEQALRTIRDERCTVFIGPMVFLSDILEQPDIEDFSLPDLELFKSSGSPRNADAIKRAYETFENITIMSGWGQTENGMVTLSRRDDPRKRTLETDGRPVPGMEVTVRDAAGNDVEVGESGELLVSGPALFDGYHRRPDLTEETFTDDGWFRSGDLAMIDDDGYVQVTGRVKDVIIRGGENISAREVEDALVDHPAVKDAGVVGVPDDRLGERPAAWIVLENGQDATEDDILSHLEEYGLQAHKQPEYLVLNRSVPRNQMGKIEKETVAEEITDRFQG